MTSWNIDFLDSSCSTGPQYALIILNQSFSLPLLQRVWHSSFWRSCADGGANRLYDLLMSHRVNPRLYLPDLIEGDLDSLRCDVKQYYASQGVPVIRNDCQDSTDLMKCVYAVQAKEQTEGQVKVLPSDNGAVSKPLEQYDIIILGGLAGRLDQTIHTLSFLHKLRRTRKRVYVVTDDNVGWVLDSGEHHIHINHSLLGQTCGLLPVGIDETTLTTTGPRLMDLSQLPITLYQTNLWFGLKHPNLYGGPLNYAPWTKKQ